MIKYSKRALLGLSYLYRKFNDIDVYVEDTNLAQLYELLINRILDGSAKVERIYQLGGKSEVIQSWNDSRQQQPERPELYIVDGDFDFFLNPPGDQTNGLYQLNVYCSENLVVSEEAVVQVIYECLDNTQVASIRDTLDLRDFKEHMWESLRELYAYFIVCRILDAGLKTTGAQVLSYRKKNSWRLSKTKIKARIKEIRSELLSEYPKTEIDFHVHNVLGQLPLDSNEGMKVLSGKTALLPVLLLFINSYCKRRGGSLRDSREGLTIRLSRHCSLDADPGLVQAIRRTSRNL